MKRRNPMIRVLSVVLVLCMVLSASPVAYAWSFSDLFGSAAPDHKLSIEQIDGVDADVKLHLNPVEHPYGTQEEFADSDMVRVSIVLKDMPALEKFDSKGISTNLNAVNYRQNLLKQQAQVTSAIEKRALGGKKMDVVWNMTLAANIISANVPYGTIDQIASVVGVEAVVLENQYAPMTGTASDKFQSSASGMIGASTAWASGYTGAGTRIAIIDTGLDTDHQSFNAGAFRYALNQQAAEKGMEPAEYIRGLDLLDEEEVEAVLKQLNIYPFVQYVSGTHTRDWYVNEKIPFALNYVDRNYQFTHDNDNQGGHGSHVAGIAAANRYIPTENGYEEAMEAVLTQGVAPDAQLVIMKVFGNKGGAYDSDYMVAIEDAIWLGCDVVNLSLGTNKGFARNRVYQHILDKLSQTDTVVAIASGNSGAWANYSGNGMGALYGDDVDFSVIGAPATATNSLAVASVDNTGFTDYYLTVNGQTLYYSLGVANNAYTKGLNVIGGLERTYVLLDGIGTAEQAAAAAAIVGDPSQAVLVCARGDISFSEKGNNAAAAGFAGCIVYNNTEGSISMDLTDYVGSGPCVSMTKADGEFLKNAAEKAAEGIFVGTMFVSDKVTSGSRGGNVTVSDFSSWGVAGNLELKPEISAPGGEIYSVNGEVPSGDAYMNNSGTSMASPQVAGMAAVLIQYIREENLVEKTGLSERALTNSLLMATSEPLVDAASGNYYPVIQQGSGLADVADALAAGSYILMDEGANAGAADGKVKVELGDDPAKTGTYSFGFTIHNFSDSAKTYTLDSDFFTQELYEIEGVSYHGKSTVDLPMNVSYTVGSQELAITSAYRCDLNGDGTTNALDAQVILEYAAGTVTAVDAKADVNADGRINTLDAHVLLAAMKTDRFTLAAGEKIHVRVSMELLDKAALEAYVNGAYIEGFVWVSTEPDAEGVIDPVYSIPVLGFYGNWSDASMYDRADYADYLYNDFVFPYTGGLNYLSMFDKTGVNESYFVGNPYMIEDKFPTGRAALHPDTELGDMSVTLIRNAAGFMFYVLDGEGKLVDARAVEQINAAYYYEAYATWVNINNVGLSIWQTPKQMGFNHGDEFTIGFLAVPEYYENGKALTQEELVEMMFSGKLGQGAFHSYSFTVDGEAPVVNFVEKDPENDNLIINATDDNYIAAIAVLNAKGSSVMKMVSADQTAAGETVTTVVDMSDVSVNRDCIIMVADYAGNESYYTVKDYNEGISDFGGRMYAFTDTVTRGNENSFMEINPEKLYYYTDDLGETFKDGTNDVASMPWSVVAAEYVEGIVFMATEEGQLYAAEQGDWENCFLVGTNKNYANIKDLAYDKSTGTLYALIGAANNIYTVDLSDGTLTKAYSVSLKFPGSVYDANYELLAMTIDDEGNFYAVNNGDANYRSIYLFTWSNADRQNGTGNVRNLAPINNTPEGYLGDYIYNDKIDYKGDQCVQSMAWDHDADILYYAAAMSAASANNILYKLDTATGKAAVATGAIEGVPEYALGGMICHVSGMYIVPSAYGDLPTAEKATEIILSDDSVSLLEGSQCRILADVLPWNLMDKSILWSSADESVATVDENGVITAVSAGETVITATTAAEPHLSASCAVSVSAVKGLELRGLLKDSQGENHWISFDITDPASWTVTGECAKDFRGGGYLEGNIYLHDGSHMYGVDANTYEITDYGYLDETWLWSDAAPAPLNPDGYYNRIVGVITGGRSFGVMDVTTGIASELPEYFLFRKDHAAVIAYKGEITHTDQYGSYPAYQYYVLTEEGTLMVLTTYAFYDTDLGGVMYDGITETIGETGLRLSGVSDPSSDRFGSMYYDARLDYLVVAVNDGEETSLYAFQPNDCAPTKLGTFGADAGAVLSLYSYNPYTDLTVTVDPASAELYKGETMKLESKVYNFATTDAVIWSSSDESIATVDAKGVVSAIAPGEVVITATSVEGDSSASASITVKELDSMDLKLHAYITTESGGQWVSIDGSDMSVEVLGRSDAVYTGAAVSEGKVYASDKEYYYEIDVQNGYTVTQGDKFTDGDGAACLYILDGTSAPKTSVTMPDLQTGKDVTVELGGKPIYLSGYDGNGYYYLTILEDYTTGKYAVSPIEYTYNPAAVTYHHSEIIEKSYYFDFYLVLGYDGLLESYSLNSSIVNGEVYTAGGWERDTFNIGLEFEDGDDVSMVYVKNESFDGVLISHVDHDGVSIYSFDMENRVLGKLGNIPGATDLVGLSLMADVGYTEEPETPETPDVPENPEEPATELSMLGYMAIDGGYAWAKINPADGTYEILAEDTVNYTGGGFAGGKFYTSYGVAKYGQTNYDFYAIDPMNGFQATVGTKCPGMSYAMADGTGTPAVTAQLAGGTVEAGGYYVYLANGPYASSAPKMAVLKDGVCSEVYVSSSAFSGKIAAIAYIGGAVNADASAYVEKFLVLGQNGNLYEALLTTKSTGLYGEAKITNIGALDLFAMSGASMTLVDEDTLMISVNDDGVVFYTYTISTGELTEMGTVSDASKLGCLTLYSDVYGLPEEPEVPEVPEEPAKDESVLGYLAVEEGYVWAKIESDGTYEILAEDTVNYTGGGFAGGKFYTSYGVSKYGQTTYTFYEIDPANGFAAKAGNTCPGSGYTMVDGTGSPAQTVTLADGTTVTAGGYYVYAANGKYASNPSRIYVLNNFAKTTYTEIYTSSSAFSGQLAGIAYIGGELADDGLSYLENFLVLAQNGDLYNVQLVTKSTGLYGAANVSKLGALDLTARSGAAMTLTGSDKLTISVNADDGVVLYGYTLSTGELTELAVIEDAVKLSCLAPYTEAFPASERFYAGSTMALGVSVDESITEEQTVSVKLVEDVDVTNGRMEITFDPAELTYMGASSLTAAYAVNASEAASGKLVIAYASEDVITAGSVIASLRFSYQGTLGADLTVSVTERNDAFDLTESQTVRLGEPEVEIIAEGWSGYTTWVLTSDGTITFTSSGEKLENGESNLKNYWKVNGVLTLPWGEYAELITKVVINDGIHDIGQMAFYELPNLTCVELGADVTEIRNYAFKNCTSLTTINMEAAEYIREGAFYGCSALENVTFAENVVIEEWAFAKTGIVIP